MGAEGYKYNEILLHYYRGAEIKKIYKFLEYFLF
jgi:peptidoglycan hydrolase-like amidase